MVHLGPAKDDLEPQWADFGLRELILSMRGLNLALRGLIWGLRGLIWSLRGLSFGPVRTD